MQCTEKECDFNGTDNLCYANVAQVKKFCKRSTEPKLAAVKPLYDSNYRDVVTTLRKIADGIERGDYGDVNEIALVVQGEKVTTFHCGKGGIERAHMLLSCGQRNLEELYRM